MQFSPVVFTARTDTHTSVTSKRINITMRNVIWCDTLCFSLYRYLFMSFVVDC